MTDAARPTISTHVLDTETGAPAPGVHVSLYKLGEDDRPIRLTQALTDADGRVRDLLERPMSTGTYRLEFNFGRNRGEAWLARTGALYIDTWVQHNGLLCSTYEVGIRFGHGEPGCTGVQWLAPAKYVTNLRQCNNAIVEHTGTDTDVAIAEQFGEVTCAERMVRCVSGCR